MDLATFRRQVSQGRKPKVALRLAGTVADVGADGDSRVVRFVFSDASVDRYGDTINVRGWKLENYRANPICLFGHNDKEVSTVVGKTVSLAIEGDKLVGDIEFMPADISKDAEAVFRMVKGGYLNAVSVGFQPLEWSATKDKSRPLGIDFKSQDLLEVSIVPVPALPTALAQARAAGIDVDRLKLLRAAPTVKRGLYEVSWLAQLLNELGYIEDTVEWEAEYEGDNSPVPAMLTDAMRQLGAALVAMTIEEVAELLGEESGDDGTAAQKAMRKLGVMARAAQTSRTITINAEPSPATLEFLDRVERAGAVLQIAKAGKTISSATETQLRAAHQDIMGGCAKIVALIDPPADDPAAEPSDETATRARKARALALTAAQ